jgi:GMP synthase-like glutamine amidotransferase
MITLFQHGSDESAGEIAICLTEWGVPYTTIRLFDGEALPENLPSGLIILGGQMSVNDSARYPFFSEEKRIIREMVAAGKPVLGICLGAQMIASAFGEAVIGGPGELGWTCIQGCGGGTRQLFPEIFTVFHWHHETFRLPPGAELLATGFVVRNQAFRLGSAVGVQFHPEVTGEIISCWSKDMVPERQEKLRDESEYFRAMNRTQCRSLIHRFLKGWDS